MKKIIKFLLLFIAVGVIFSLMINYYVVYSTKSRIKKYSGIDEKADCILVLGAGVWGSEPSPMLNDRLLEGIALYKEGYAKKIIMSGDHGTKYYDEVNVMKDFAIREGVPSSDIFMDHAGFSTYESLYRAKEIFGVKKVIVVTQEYHLYRALYIAKKLGLDAYGVNSDPRAYVNQKGRDIREILARNKDVITCIIKPEPTYLGEKIDILGDGNMTNDK